MRVKVFHRRPGFRFRLNFPDILAVPTRAQSTGESTPAVETAPTAETTASEAPASAVASVGSADAIPASPAPVGSTTPSIRSVTTAEAVPVTQSDPIPAKIARTPQAEVGHGSPAPEPGGDDPTPPRIRVVDIHVWRGAIRWQVRVLVPVGHPHPPVLFRVDPLTVFGRFLPGGPLGLVRRRLGKHRRGRRRRTGGCR
jgi:hypothetical protein